MGQRLRKRGRSMARQGLQLGSQGYLLMHGSSSQSQQTFRQRQRLWHRSPIKCSRRLPRLRLRCGYTGIHVAPGRRSGRSSGISKLFFPSAESLTGQVTIEGERVLNPAHAGRKNNHMHRNENRWLLGSRHRLLKTSRWN